jgi:centromere protein I
MDSPATDENISTLIRDVVEASKLTAQARSVDIKPTVAHLASAIYERGLLPGGLNELIDLITIPSHLSQASLSSLVGSLYPATRISSDVVLRIVACLGHGQLKPSLNLQAALIRWLILVYHVLESPTVLSQTYHVLFGLLDTVALRFGGLI